MVGECEDRGVPLLGVCLGHQAIAVAHGATVSRAPELLHGKTSEVEHAGAGVLHDLPSPFTATRYHSLAVEEATLPPELAVTARTAGGVVMALRHRDRPVEGVQFHPESVLTQGGHLMLASWLRACGDTGAAAWPRRCPTGSRPSGWPPSAEPARPSVARATPARAPSAPGHDRGCRP
jgi:para-aminobenzoate synthetase component 2